MIRWDRICVIVAKGPDLFLGEGLWILNINDYTALAQANEYDGREIDVPCMKRAARMNPRFSLCLGWPWGLFLPFQ